MRADAAASFLHATALAAALALCLTLEAREADAQDASCGDGTPFELGFDSGSTWTGCLRVDAEHGLELGALSWRAPGDASRPVLAALHPASILVQRAGERAPAERIGVPAATLDESPATCTGERLTVGDASVCARRTSAGLLAKYGDIAGLHGALWWLESARTVAGETWWTRIALGESGRIEPTLALTGVTADPDTARERTLRTVWRIAFALDAPAPDRVEELDFALAPGADGRRPMRVTPLRVETLRRTSPATFRAWRIVDPNGAGYLLDPQTSVASPPAFGPNWTSFELAVTARRDAERHASAPPTLDGFVDGEPLAGEDPVLWHAVATTVRPSAEDRPVLRARTLGFALVPFDWTSASPFTGGGS